MPGAKSVHNAFSRTWFAALLSTAYVVSLLLVFPRTYYINDNIGILEDIRQGWVVSFLSSLLGKMLSLGYLEISDAIPWYGILLYLGLGLSLLLSVSAIRRLPAHHYIKIAFSALILMMYFPFIMRIDYTGVSILLGVNSLLCLLVYLHTTARPRPWVLLSLGLLLALSFLVKTYAILAVFVFSAPFVLLGILRGFPKRVTAFLVFLLPLAAAMTADHLYVKQITDKEYLAFQEWNRLRGEFHGNPVSSLNKGNKEIQRVNQWSENDYLILQEWSYLDENKYNSEKLKNIFKYSVPLPEPDRVGPGNLYSALIEIIASTKAQSLSFLLVGFTSFLLLDFRRSLGQLFYLAYVFLGGATMLILLRFPGQVSYPLITSGVLWLFYGMFKPVNKTANFPAGARARATTAVIIIMGVLAFANAVMGVKWAAQIRERQALFYRNIEKLEGYQADFFVINMPSGIRFEYQDPLDTDRHMENRIPMGWPIFSPRFYKVLGSVNMQQAWEVYPKLVDNHKAFLVGDEEFVDRISIFLHENHQMKCTGVKVDSLATGTGIYQLRRVDHGNG